MAQIKISALTTGSPKGTDETPATDTTDTTQAASGTTKKYIRSDELNFYLTAQGLRTLQACRVGTVSALTVVYANGVLGVGATLTNAGAQAAIAIDGVTLSLGDRVLVKNQASQAQNGIYTVTTLGSGATNWVMTRATDYDQAAEVQEDDVVLVNQGTVNAGLLFQETGAAPFTIGTTAIIFTRYSTANVSFTWVDVTATSQQMAVNNGYITNNVGLVTLTLPAVSVVGDTLAVVGLGAGGWIIAQNAGQIVHIGSVASTTGVGGSVASTNRYDSLRLVCVVASTEWSLVGAPQSAGLTIV